MQCVETVALCIKIFVKGPFVDIMNKCTIVQNPPRTLRMRQHGGRKQMLSGGAT